MNPGSGAEAFATRRPGRTHTGDLREGASLSGVDWRPEQKRVFKEICGPVMEQFGYEC